MTKELLSVKDITEITGWSKSTVYKLVKAGQLPTVDIPEAPVRINRIKFMELINGRTNLWYKVDVRLSDKFEVLHIAKRLGISSNECVDYLSCGAYH